MNIRTIILEVLTILSSFGTLLCCALPALLVSVGAGAVMASVVSAFPQAVWISEHKIALFAFAGAMLFISGTSTYANRRTPCPTDPVTAESCMRARRLSAGIFLASLIVYAIGFFFAFVASKIV
jgi:hypothetical protein